MSSPSKGKSEFVLGLTQNDARVLLLGLLTTGEQGKVDYDKLAEKGGWKNAATAAVTYRNAKNKFTKLMAGNTGDAGDADNAGDADDTAAPGSATEAATPVKKAPTKRKAKAKAEQGDVNGDAGDEVSGAAAASASATEEASAAETPKKRQRKTPIKKKGIAVKINKKKVKAEIDDEDGLDEDAPIATPTKPKSKSKATPKSKAAAKKEEELTDAGDHAEDDPVSALTDTAGDMELPSESDVEREIDAMDSAPDDVEPSMASAA